MVRSKTDAETQGTVVAITPAAMQALDAIRPLGVGGEAKVFRLSESQIARRVKAIAKAAGLGPVDKLLPKNDRQCKPTELSPYVASRR